MRSLRRWLFLAAFVALPALPQSTPATSAQQLQEPKWPQSFQIQDLQVLTYGFAVTQPGSIIVSVQGQGAPLSVSLQGPLPNPQAPLVQNGVGTLRIQYAVTAQDVQRGVLWQTQIRLAQAPRSQAAVSPGGSVTVQHPPVDQTLVQKTIQAMAAQRRALTPAETAQAFSQASRARDADFTAYKTQLAQRRAQNRAANVAQLQPMLSDMLRQKASFQQPAGAAQIKSRGLTPPTSFRPVPFAAPSISGISVAHDQDQLNLPPGSAPYGQPGDGVTISGSGFGNDDGEVHFVIGPSPSQDLITLPGNAIWVNNQIFSPVPSVSGYVAYSGVIYIKRKSDGAKSNLVPFQFEPDMELREIRMIQDAVFPQIGNVVNSTEYDGHLIRHSNNNWFSGVNGVDSLFLTTKLKNGWVLAQRPVVYLPDNEVGGQAFAIGGAVGSDVLSMAVGFSVNPAINWPAVLDYAVIIPIQGPSGIPDGVVCVSAPPANTACPSTN
jgi:hypothetical protein